MDPLTRLQALEDQLAELQTQNADLKNKLDNSTRLTDGLVDTRVMGKPDFFHGDVPAKFKDWEVVTHAYAGAVSSAMQDDMDMAKQVDIRIQNVNLNAFFAFVKRLSLLLWLLNH